MTPFSTWGREAGELMRCLLRETPTPSNLLREIPITVDVSMSLRNCTSLSAACACMLREVRLLVRCVPACLSVCLSVFIVWSRAICLVDMAFRPLFPPLSVCCCSSSSPVLLRTVRIVVTSFSCV